MSLAIFDLDHTLLAGDSDHSWGCFLADKGIVDAQHYRQTNDRFYQAYQDGTLDIYGFLAFTFKPLQDNLMQHLLEWRKEFLETIITPMILPKALELVEHHRTAGHTAIIITATNRFLTEKIAERFGIPHLLATEPEVRNGQFTGQVAGIPCFREGKILRLREWLQQHNQTLTDSWFYSDSHNDIPLLEQVSHPIAVDPDDKLAQYASNRKWKQISLRH